MGHSEKIYNPKNNRMISPGRVPHNINASGVQLRITSGVSRWQEEAPERFEMSDAAKKKFVKYLKLLFEDLCARDNGNTRSSFGLYTFLKVSFRESSSFSMHMASLTTWREGFSC
jgi:hypothetical protein